MSTVYEQMQAIVEKAATNTERRADLAQNIVDALIEDGPTLYFSEGVTLYIADPKLSPTHATETGDGVVVEYRYDRAISYFFPAGSVVEVLSS